MPHHRICALDPSDRSSGLLLHPTSLPTPYGIGDLGPQARRLVEYLARTDTGLWQTLPLGPTGFGDSPYQSFSSHAGNVNLLSPDDLAADGLLDPDDLAALRLPDGPVDFAAVRASRARWIPELWRRFERGAAPHLRGPFEHFVATQQPWLDDFALFMALKDHHDGAPWAQWPEPLRDRDPAAVADARTVHAERIAVERFAQYLFCRQLLALRRLAKAAGIRPVGAVPLYVAWDSVDVWTRPDLFRLRPDGTPAVVAGVPPDYFSPTGQLWGNPIYDWEAHAADGYRWWADRLAAAFAMADIVRIDHFRAFADYWEIPADAPTAETGRWVDGPGLGFFEAVVDRLGPLPVIAEDLGELSPAVPRLLDATGFPGMRVLQFAFDSDDTNPFLPRNYPPRCVAYTGTHDNDTTLGWWRSAPEPERAFARRILGVDDTDPVGAFLDAVWSSPAMFALAPAQDLLRLGSEARMNTPGTVGGRNWRWRMTPDQLDEHLLDEVARLNAAHGRASHVS